MSAQTDLPAPLIPADTDITGLPGFMLNVERLFASELWALSTGDEMKAALALWGRAWQQSPAGSLPNDERLLAAFSGAGPRWKRVRAMALRGFVLCSDNRLYHRVLCEDVLRAARHKDLRRERTAAATKARLAKEDNDPTPPPKGKKTNEINKTTSRNETRHEARNVERDEDRNEVRHEQRNDAATLTLRESLRSPIDRTGQDKTLEDIPAAACEPVPRASAAAADRPAWNSRENYDRVEKRCRSALPPGWVNDFAVGPMVLLEHDGLDLEREIIPAILDLAASRRVPIRTWTLLADAIAERIRVQRAGRVAEGLPPTPAAASGQPSVDLGSHGLWPESAIRSWIIRHRDNPRNWDEAVFGPPPGAPGCRIPSRLLIGEAA
ncbi:DUF1376 domain-containing protein [Methylobacterium segetis]|uniref:DUF1376 domain-containing protein n=1 Tax=Methylobacterium segetis TaxID=2488750 RepID=UPI001048C4E8|nr:DUF1376 domain-containing protein [Methylobacterium segetis]